MPVHWNWLKCNSFQLATMMVAKHIFIDFNWKFHLTERDFLPCTSHAWIQLARINDAFTSDFIFLWNFRMNPQPCVWYWQNSFTILAFFLHSFHIFDSFAFGMFDNNRMFECWQIWIEYYKQHQFWFMIKLSFDSPVLLQIEQKPICNSKRR